MTDWSLDNSAGVLCLDVGMLAVFLRVDVAPYAAFFQGVVLLLVCVLWAGCCQVFNAVRGWVRAMWSVRDLSRGLPVPHWREWSELMTQQRAALLRVRTWETGGGDACTGSTEDCLS